jgi:hypothetical protein
MADDTPQSGRSESAEHPAGLTWESVAPDLRWADAPPLACWSRPLSEITAPIADAVLVDVDERGAR